VRSDQTKPKRVEVALRLVPMAFHLSPPVDPWGLYVTRKHGRMEVDTQGIMLFPVQEPHKPTLFPWSCLGPVSFEYVEATPESKEPKAARG
jgi:hypothetical protein